MHFLILWQQRLNKVSKELKITKDELAIEVGGNHHPIDVLSSGERHILTFLALIVVTGRNKDFIIIDEPEISLNMKWQRSLLELLKRIAPDTQIIVASHSPAIAKRQVHKNCLYKMTANFDVTHLQQMLLQDVGQPSFDYIRARFEGLVQA